MAKDNFADFREGLLPGLLLVNKDSTDLFVIAGAIGIANYIGENIPYVWFKNADEPLDSVHKASK